MIQGPRDDDVTVFWAHSRRDLIGFSHLLDGAEEERSGALRNEADRRRFIAGRVFARLVLAELMHCDPFDLAITARCAACGGPHGRPVVLAPPGLAVPQLSLARSGDRVMVAVSSLGAVGVDLQALQPQALLAAEPVALSESEIAALPHARADRVIALGRLWARKEALLKAAGWGLTVDPATISAEHREGFAVQDLELGAGWAAAVALKGAGRMKVLLSRRDDLFSRPLADGEGRQRLIVEPSPEQGRTRLPGMDPGEGDEV